MLRVRPGERGVAVSDGRQFVVEVVEASGERVLGHIVSEQPAVGEPEVPLSLLQAVLPNPQCPLAGDRPFGSGAESSRDDP